MTSDATYLPVGPEGIVAPGLPPLTLPDHRPRPGRSIDWFPRLGRFACVLAALALPAVGISIADTVHRAGEPRASQAAAPVAPLDRAAARPDHRRGEMPR